MYLYTNHRFCVIVQEINGLWRISPSSTYTTGVPTLHMIPADDMNAQTGNVGGGVRAFAPTGLCTTDRSETKRTGATPSAFFFIYINPPNADPLL